jgi:hypothetical protein
MQSKSVQVKGSLNFAKSMHLEEEHSALSKLPSLDDKTQPSLNRSQRMSSDGNLQPANTREPSQRIRKPSVYIQHLQTGEGVAALADKTTSVMRENIPTDDYDEEHELATVISEAKGVTPVSDAEARRLPECEEWEAAMKKELAVLEKMKTWEEVKKSDLPEGANVVGCKWVYRIKTDVDGTPFGRKARLVAQGFSQIPGTDYFDTYSPVAKLASLPTSPSLHARISSSSR